MQKLTTATSALALLGAFSIAAHLASDEGVAATPAAEAASDDACSRLAGQKLDKVEIVSAHTQPEGVPVGGGGGRAGPSATGPTPQFCRVVGRIVPEAGSSIGFETWLPSSGWQGRLHGAGMGGFAGSIDYAALNAAVKAGEAGVSTDTGHQGTMMDTAWAKGNPAKVRDYGWRAIHLATVAAKGLAKAFYGSGPKYSYFVGCSGGGRQGLMEAARFPEDYDGIMAGAPAASWTDLAIAMANAVLAQHTSGAALRANQLETIQTEVIAQCDALDGQVDGLVDDPRQCKFDASRLACGVSKATQCLAPAQLTALKQIFRGPRSSSGRQLASGFLPSGSEVGAPSGFGWETYLVNGRDGRSGSEKHIAGLFQDLVQGPFTTPATFDLDKDPARLKAALSADLDAPQNLQRFFARGGKLILWHGWADPAIPPGATIAYRDAVLRQSGARANTSMRLFMVPGLQHCMGGTGPISFGQTNPPQASDTPQRNVVSALHHWVEQGRVPDTLVASRGFGGVFGLPPVLPDRQRLLCAYPKRSVLRPGGDPDKAANYSCK